MLLPRQSSMACCNGRSRPRTRALAKSKALVLCSTLIFIFLWSFSTQCAETEGKALQKQLQAAKANYKAVESRLVKYTLTVQGTADEAIIQYHFHRAKSAAHEAENNIYYLEYDSATDHITTLENSVRILRELASELEGTPRDVISRDGQLDAQIGVVKEVLPVNSTGMKKRALIASELDFVSRILYKAERHGCTIPPRYARDKQASSLTLTQFPQHLSGYFYLNDAYIALMMLEYHRAHATAYEGYSAGTAALQKCGVNPSKVPSER